MTGGSTLEELLLSDLGVQNRDYLRRAMEVLPLGVVLLGRGGHVLSVNPAALAIFCRRADELVGRDAHDFIAPEDAAVVAARVRSIEDGHAPGAVEVRLVRGDESRVWVRMGCGPLPDDRGNPVGFVAHFVDITAERGEREARQLLEENVRQMQRIEAVERLAGGVAHDFNNMLAVILGSANLARARATDPRLVELISTIQDAAARSKALARQLMILGRHPTDDPGRLDLHDAIRRIEPLLRRTLGEDVSLEIDLGAPAATVLLPASHAEQILMNLVTNARDAMPGGGRLRLGTTCSDVDGVPVVELTVSDTGVGMTEEVRARAFDPYYTTKGSGRGTGLGLSVVWSIVQKAKGRIEIESVPGWGSRFRLRFPTVGGQVPVALVRDDDSEPPSGHGERVVLVEDEPALLLMIQQILEEFGYSVRAFGDPRLALEHLNGGDPVDLLLTDVVMPGVSGAELTIEAWRSRPALRVLLISGHPADRLSRNRLKSTVTLLQKPFQAEELLKKVREVLDDGVALARP